MIDSGAHSLYEQIVKRQGKGYKYFETDEFWQYVDEYAEFIKTYKDFIDVYVNVDVIFNPELTWKVQRYLEDHHKLNPLPVFHYGENIKWLIKYMDNYDYIGIGGIGQDVSADEYVNFGDRVFKIICDNKGEPLRRTHGFAITTNRLVYRYPWYSVDSTTWALIAGYGGILIPFFKDGKFYYNKAPNKILVSKRSFTGSNSKFHYQNLSESSKKIVSKYLKAKGFMIDWDDLADEDENFSTNVVVSYRSRRKVNILYYLDMENDLRKRVNLFKPVLPTFFETKSNNSHRCKPWEGVCIYLSSGSDIIRYDLDLPVTHVLESYWALRSKNTSEKFFNMIKESIDGCNKRRYSEKAINS